MKTIRNVLVFLATGVVITVVDQLARLFSHFFLGGS